MTNVVVTQETIDRLADDLAARQLNAEVEIFTEMFEEATRKGFIQQQANQKPTSLEFAANALRQYAEALESEELSGAGRYYPADLYDEADRLEKDR